MNIKEAREIIGRPRIVDNRTYPMAKKHHEMKKEMMLCWEGFRGYAKGYLEAIEKAKGLWEALMDIGVEPDHECKCKCAEHGVDHAREAIAKWEKTK